MSSTFGAVVLLSTASPPWFSFSQPPGYKYIIIRKIVSISFMNTHSRQYSRRRLHHSYTAARTIRGGPKHQTPRPKLLLGPPLVATIQSRSICPCFPHTNQAVLNSDSESVLVKGLRRFASLIRREHGLLPPTPATSSGRCRLNPNGANAHQEAAAHPHGKKAGGLVGQAGGTDEMEVLSLIHI